MKLPSVRIVGVFACGVLFGLAQFSPDKMALYPDSSLLHAAF